MDWSPYLEKGERMRWEIRPAPRCFTFRNWRHSLFGFFLMLLALYWEIVGYELAVVYDQPWIAWIPIPVLIIAIYLSVGQLLLARLEWEKVFYAVTDRRILALGGTFRRRLHSLALEEMTYFQLKPLGENIGTLRIAGDPSQPPLVLHCIEHPRKVTDLLEEVLTDSGEVAAPEMV